MTNENVFDKTAKKTEIISIDKIRYTRYFWNILRGVKVLGLIILGKFGGRGRAERITDHMDAKYQGMNCRIVSESTGFKRRLERNDSCRGRYGTKIRGNVLSTNGPI